MILRKQPFIIQERLSTRGSLPFGHFLIVYECCFGISAERIAEAVHAKNLWTDVLLAMPFDRGRVARLPELTGFSYEDKKKAFRV